MMLLLPLRSVITARLGVDDDGASRSPVPNPVRNAVPNAGHFNWALLGHSWRAPKSPFL